MEEQVQFLTIKPALIYYSINPDKVTYTIYPETMPGFQWRLLSVLKAQRCPVHLHKPEVGCCGIHTTLNMGETTRRWLTATDPTYPLMFMLVQTMGNIDIDDVSWEVRAEKVYLWGIVKPRWISSDAFSSLLNQIIEHEDANPEVYDSFYDMGIALKTHNKKFFMSCGQEPLYNKWVVSSLILMRREISKYHAEN